MARAPFENALPADDIDRLFEENATRQYTRDLLFSQVVDLMGVVVCKVRPSLSAAIQRRADLPVTRKAVYDKIDRTEPALGSALVRHTADRLAPVLGELGGLPGPAVPGYRLRVVDGSHLAATEHRIKPLRLTRAGALPGQALVAYDPRTGLVTDVICCEDGHAQERSLTPELLALARPGDLWLADRNFRTTRLLAGFAARGACFVIRRHASTLTVEAEGPPSDGGRTDTGRVSERPLVLSDGAGGRLALRQVTIELDRPTRGGESAVHVLTNLPPGAADARAVAELYRSRWQVEGAFQELEAALRGEVETLGYPKAALFAFCVALTAFNVLAAIKAALRSAHGAAGASASGYHLAEEVAAASRGLQIAVPAGAWSAFAGLGPAAMAAWLLGVARRVRPAAFRKQPRGPKRPRPKRESGARIKHRSTAKLLKQRT
jgi:hypothetical protein